MSESEQHLFQLSVSARRFLPRHNTDSEAPEETFKRLVEETLWGKDNAFAGLVTLSQKDRFTMEMAEALNRVLDRCGSRINRLTLPNIFAESAPFFMNIKVKYRIGPEKDLVVRGAIARFIQILTQPPGKGWKNQARYLLPQSPYRFSKHSLPEETFPDPLTD